jgi:hypothetical protein
MHKRILAYAVIILSVVYFYSSEAQQPNCHSPLIEASGVCINSDDLKPHESSVFRIRDIGKPVTEDIIKVITKPISDEVGDAYDPMISGMTYLAIQLDDSPTPELFLKDYFKLCGNSGCMGYIMKIDIPVPRIIGYFNSYDEVRVKEPFLRLFRNHSFKSITVTDGHEYESTLEYDSELGKYKD